MDLRREKKKHPWLKTYLRNQHPITSRDTHRQPLALPIKRARADSEDFGLVELLDARLGEEDAAGGLGLGLDALDEHAVEEGDEGADGADRGGLFFDVGRWLALGMIKILGWRLR